MGDRQTNGSDDRVEWLGQPELLVSVVLATRNRATRLEACLRAISAMDLSPQSWELIVADNGSTDATAEVVRAAQHYMPTTIKYVFEPARGASAARNSGTAVSAGKIIAYTDDDCYVAPDFLSKIVEAFEANPKVGWITGRVELFDLSDDPATTNSSRIPRRFLPKRFVPADQVIGANLAIRREIMNRLGGYDEILGAGAPLAAAEDLDLVSRISARGWEGAYDPNVVLSHHHGRKTEDVASLYKQYNVGRGAYTIKYLYRGQIVAFVRSVAQLRFRLGPIWTWFTPEKFSMVFWETYGGVAYSGLRIMQVLGIRQSTARRRATATHIAPTAFRGSSNADIVQGDGC